MVLEEKMIGSWQGKMKRHGKIAIEGTI